MAPGRRLETGTAPKLRRAYTHSKESVILAAIIHEKPQIISSEYLIGEQIVDDFFGQYLGELFA